MRKNVPSKTTIIDKNKRRTLITLSSTIVGSVLASSPMIGNTKSTPAGANSPKANVARLQADLEVALVSIPGVKREALKITNLTDRDILIDRFRPGNLVFDGEVVDCNDACAISSIEIPASDDVLIQFEHTALSELDAPASEYLDVSPLVSRLPAGTRIIRLSATMLGRIAVLTHSGANPAA